MAIMAICREFGCLEKDRWPCIERKVDIEMVDKLLAPSCRQQLSQFLSRLLSKIKKWTTFANKGPNFPTTKLQKYSIWQKSLHESAKAGLFLNSSPYSISNAGPVLFLCKGSYWKRIFILKFS
jgi:hypothetical protein